MCSFRFGYVDEMGTFISEANLESFLRSKQGTSSVAGYNMLLVVSLTVSDMHALISQSIAIVRI